MKLFITILIIFFALLLIFEILQLINSMVKFFDEKTKKTKAETLEIINNKSAKPSFDITDDLISLLNYMIDNEIQFRINLLSYSRSPYQLLNMDKDIQSISKQVFDNLNKGVLNEAEIMIKPDYIMHFIVNQVTVRLASSMRQYNLSVTMNSEESES